MAGDLVHRSVRKAGRGAVRGWLIVALLGLWELRARQRPSLFVPEVSAIADRFQELWLSGPATRLFVSDQLIDNVAPSLARMGRGWLLAIGIGIPLGLVLGASARLAWMVNPVIRFGMATPSVMLLPLAIAVFGITDSMNIFVITLGSIWPVLINTIDGVHGVDRVAILSGRSMRLGRLASLRYVLLPGASPQIVAGLRISLGVALILMVSSELFAVTEGLGRFILASQQSFRFLDVWAGVFLIGLLGLTINLVFAAFERRVLHWHIASRAVG